MPPGGPRPTPNTINTIVFSGSPTHPIANPKRCLGRPLPCILPQSQLVCRPDLTWKWNIYKRKDYGPQRMNCVRSAEVWRRQHRVLSSHLCCGRPPPAWTHAKKSRRNSAGWNSLVGATGFEPATLCSQSRCATGLRYAPKLDKFSNYACDCQASDRLLAKVGTGSPP